MCLQSITGVMIQAFMVGVVFAKLSRPKKRTQTLLFSRHAVICQRDGELCLMFRVGDMRKSHIIEAHVRAQLIKRKLWSTYSYFGRRLRAFAFWREIPVPPPNKMAAKIVCDSANCHYPKSDTVVTTVGSRSGRCFVLCPGLGSSSPKAKTATLIVTRVLVTIFPCQSVLEPDVLFVTKEGELLPFCQTELKVGGDGEEDKIFFIWPTTIVHKITSSSPLYTLSAADMLRERFEIVVILEGVIESTGMTTQARSSYLPGEILWGHRFQHLVTFKKETGEHEVDYSLFNDTYEVDTPLCSAMELDNLTQQSRPVLVFLHIAPNLVSSAPLRLLFAATVSDPVIIPDIQKYPVSPDLTSVESQSVGDSCIVQLQHVPGPESRI
ncbi:Inward rectifier potassium channel [Homalodisca vitripennis]|nr:Inward rectifier potassium channel [Homalodisca vitripennis]